MSCSMGFRKTASETVATNPPPDRADRVAEKEVKSGAVRISHGILREQPVRKVVGQG